MMLIRSFVIQVDVHVVVANPRYAIEVLYLTETPGVTGCYTVYNSCHCEINKRHKALMSTC